MNMSGASSGDKGLRSRCWRLTYKTSSTIIDGRPVDILKDFYIPVLQLSARYDRVAGFFRSSSLAAASQGFSSFAGRQGRMRLIVAADLDAADVKAILDGDEQRMVNKLNDVLKEPEAWPEDVRRGVTLLAWMVAHEYLEVRVAFRVHIRTGEPLAMEALDDGYVHEKWFVLCDEYGNRLYGAGTLNESKTALLHNAENIDLHCDWWGETERLRIAEAVAAFENLWFNRVPHILVLTLPEGVRRELVRLAEGVESPLEIDGTSAAPKKVEPPSVLEKLKFAVLREAAKMPGGRYVGLETAPVAPWPHQAVVVRRLVETWPYCHLLCDEVGLGKTIEAGLAFRSLYLSGLAKRILIAAPASVTPQWLRQMASKVLLPFGLARTAPETGHTYLLPAEEVRPARSLYEPDLVIVSTGLLARQECVAALQGAELFDIALVDEAHAARRRNPTGGVKEHPDYGYLYSTIQNYLHPKARSLWLATATPLQIDPVEACDLLALTDRAGVFQYDPSLTMQYYAILGKLINREEPDRSEWDFLRRVAARLPLEDPLMWQFVERSVIDGRVRSTTRQWLDHGRIPVGRDRELLHKLFFSVAPLSRVMLRHTRRLLEIYRENGQLRQNLARRHILPMPRIVFMPLERTVYDQLEKYCEGLSRQLRLHGDPQTRQMVRFLLSFLRLRFASSLFAIRETLRRRLQKVDATLLHQLELETSDPEAGASLLEDLIDEEIDEDDQVAVASLLRKRNVPDLEWERVQLKKILDAMADLTGTSSKMQELLKILERRRERGQRRIKQTVVFTRFFDTLTDIVKRLRQADPEMLTGTYSGQGAEIYVRQLGRMISLNREEVRERFLRGEFDVLVCTDAAAEGLNLQSADLLVNFDLGWNPMKVEQRIGRIDRIGQKHADIYVLNLCYAGSAEEEVYGRLLSRLAEANLIVGAQQLSLLPVVPDDFRELAEGELSPEALENRARERIEQQRRHTESMEIDPRVLYEIYTRLERTVPSPVNLEQIWEALDGSEYLRNLGCRAPDGSGPEIITVSGVAGVPDGTILTISRDLYEEGLAGRESRVRFASYGEPVFAAILEHLASFGLPGCVRRLAVPVPELGTEMVSYAAACRAGNGAYQVKLISSYRELEGLELAEDISLTDSDTALPLESLKAKAADEFGFHKVAKRIERGNVNTARAQEILNLLVARALLHEKAGFDGTGANFGAVAREVEALFADREMVNVAGLPAGLLRPLAKELLFDCHVPAVGDIAHMYVPRILARTALDCAYRLVDSMKTRKSELKVETVITRLQREAEELREALKWNGVR